MVYSPVRIGCTVFIIDTDERYEVNFETMKEEAAVEEETSKEVQTLVAAEAAPRVREQVLEEHATVRTLFTLVPGTNPKSSFCASC